MSSTLPQSQVLQSIRRRGIRPGGDPIVIHRKGHVEIIPVGLGYDYLREVQDLLGGAPQRPPLTDGERAAIADAQAKVYDAHAAVMKRPDKLTESWVLEAETRHRDLLIAAGSALRPAGPPTAAPWADVGTPTLLTNGATFILDRPEEIPRIWGVGNEVLWTEGEALMIVGPQGVGKTTLAQQLAMARMGLRGELLGMAVEPGRRKVLYIAADRPSQASRSMRRMTTEADRAVLAKRLVVAEGPPGRDFAKHPEALAELARQADADTVFIDSLKDIALKLSEDETGGAYNRARQLALRDGVQIIELHHQTKRGGGGQGSKPNTLADVYGSTWLTSGAGSVLLLWGEAGDLVIEARHLKQPAEPWGPAKLTHDHLRGVTELYAQPDLIDAIRRAGTYTTEQAARLLFDLSGTVPPKDRLKAQRKLDSLVRAGALIRTEGAIGGHGGRESNSYRLASITDLKP